MQKTDRGTRHLAVDLENRILPLRVRINTILDGTLIFTRRIEVTNNSDKHMALTAIYPWTSALIGMKECWGNLNTPKISDNAFTLSYFTKSDHCSERWFDWKQIPLGTTVTGGMNQLYCNSC